MGLADVIRSAIVGPVKSIAGPLRTTITHTALTGRGTFGPTYAAPVTRLALVEETSQLVASADGTEKVSAAKFTFFEQIDVNEGDRITLNGVTATVIKVGGLLDPTGKPYLPEAWTGR